MNDRASTDTKERKNPYKILALSRYDTIRNVSINSIDYIYIYIKLSYPTFKHTVYDVIALSGHAIWGSRSRKYASAYRLPSPLIK